MNKILNYKILEVGTYELHVASVLSVIALLILLRLILFVIKRALNRSFNLDLARSYSFYNLIKYIVYIIGGALSLQLLGFNLSVLIAGSAALLVGVGLGLQDLFSDFVSGIIILIDSSVKVNDIIEVNGMVCKVQEIKLRTTTVITRDDRYIILPNSDLTKNRLINWTHNNISSRFDIKVGVDYSSDINLVTAILVDAVNQQQGIESDPKPFARFIDYGESSLNFEVYFWTNNVFRVESLKSELRGRIFTKFKEHHIVIPFPQRVIHNATAN